MPGMSSTRSFFTKTSEEQNLREQFEEGPAFKRAKFCFWPIVISVPLFFRLCRNSGGICWFFYGLVGGGFLLHESLKAKKK